MNGSIYQAPPTSEDNLARQSLIIDLIKAGGVPLPIDIDVRTSIANFLEDAPEGIITSPALSQLGILLNLGPYATERQYNTLVREIGITSILHRSWDEEPGLVMMHRNRDFQSPGLLIYDLRLGAEALKLADLAAANEALIKALGLPIFSDGNNLGVRSILDLYGGDGDHRKAIKVLQEMNYLILDHQTFYDHIPGYYFKKFDGESFWVNELPISNSIIYTGRSIRLLDDPLLLWSNMIHEFGSHILMGTYLKPQLRMPSGEVVGLHPKLLFPVWFWEGSANVIALRYFHHRDERIEGVSHETDFNDFFLDTWDGKIPNSEQILVADENLSYFFHTVFCSYVLQGLGRHLDPKGVSPADWASVPSTRHTVLGLQFMLQVINNEIYRLPPLNRVHNFEIGNAYMEQIYTRMAQSISGVKRVQVVPFRKLCQQFDMSRTSYVANWIKQHFAPDQQQKAFEIMGIPSTK